MAAAAPKHGAATQEGAASAFRNCKGTEAVAVAKPRRPRSRTAGPAAAEADAQVAAATVAADQRGLLWQLAAPTGMPIYSALLAYCLGPSGEAELAQQQLEGQAHQGVVPAGLPVEPAAPTGAAAKVRWPV